MRILIVKLSSLGDVIQTMAVVPDLLAAFPDAQIDWVVEEAFAPLVARVRGLRAVLPIAQRRWRKSYFSAATRAQRGLFYARLRQDAYDAVIDFQGLTLSFMLASFKRAVLSFVCVKFQVTCCCQIQGFCPDSDFHEVTDVEALKAPKALSHPAPCC